MKTEASISKAQWKGIRRRRNRGLSLAEVLIALAIMALLMTATAMAFDAALHSYKTNHDLASVSIAARNALHRMCNTIRSAWKDPSDPTTVMEVNAAGTECAFTDADGQDIIYRYDENSHELQMNIDGGAQWYTLVENVHPVVVGDRIFTATDPTEPGFDPGTVGRMEIRFMVSQEGISRTISAAAVPRNVLYALN